MTERSAEKKTGGNFARKEYVWPEKKNEELMEDRL